MSLIKKILQSLSRGAALSRNIDVTSTGRSGSGAPEPIRTATSNGYPNAREIHLAILSLKGRIKSVSEDHDRSRQDSSRLLEEIRAQVDGQNRRLEELQEHRHGLMNQELTGVTARLDERMDSLVQALHRIQTDQLAFHKTQDSGRQESAKRFEVLNDRIEVLAGQLEHHTHQIAALRTEQASIPLQWQTRFDDERLALENRLEKLLAKIYQGQNVQLDLSSRLDGLSSSLHSLEQATRVNGQPAEGPEIPAEATGGLNLELNERLDRLARLCSANEQMHSELERRLDEADAKFRGLSAESRELKQKLAETVEAHCTQVSALAEKVSARLDYPRQLGTEILRLKEVTDRIDEDVNDGKRRLDQVESTSRQWMDRSSFLDRRLTHLERIAEEINQFREKISGLSESQKKTSDRVVALNALILESKQSDTIIEDLGAGLEGGIGPGPDPEPLPDELIEVILETAPGAPDENRYWIDFLHQQRRASAGEIWLCHELRRDWGHHPEFNICFPVGVPAGIEKQDLVTWEESFGFIRTYPDLQTAQEKAIDDLVNDCTNWINNPQLHTISRDFRARVRFLTHERRARLGFVIHEREEEALPQ
jgi:ABC-type transporter Mla subunit MlaD